MFTETSRYRKSPQYAVTDLRGRTVRVSAVPEAVPQPILGYHVLRQGQRMDHLAAQYLGNPTAFWRIAEANEVMLPEALTEQTEIAIPVK